MNRQDVLMNRVDPVLNKRIDGLYDSYFFSPRKRDIKAICDELVKTKVMKDYKISSFNQYGVTIKYTLVEFPKTWLTRKFTVRN